MINNRFKILKIIGEGRSKVFHCVDLKSNENYAVKILPPDLSPEEYEKFAEEYNTLQRLNHPGIIKAYEYGTVLESGYDYIEPGSKYIVLELFNGTELSRLRNLSEEYLREIIIQVSSALQYLHLSNYIYYDLKPENILAAEDGGHLIIRIIDLGFAKLKDDAAEKNTRGTAEYIAPELLKNEPYDHRVDYYSLGILLYKLIYDTYPFDNTSELKIFRAQLENSFDFPKSRYSDVIINLARKLLEKDPELRYLNAMQIFADLEFEPGAEIITSWIPAKTFTDRKDVINIVNNYLQNHSSGEIFIIKGSEDSGKSAVLKYISERNSEAIFIDNARSTTGIEFLKNFLERLFYCECIYNDTDDILKGRIKEFLEETPPNITEELKGIISQISRSGEFTLLIDDFNYLDELALFVLKEIIPLFQVHNIKVILAEDSERAALSGFIHNQHLINLSPFTEGQVQDFLDKSVYFYYPKEELKKTILQYADLLPGSITAFIKDLVLFGIIRYYPDGIKVITDAKNVDILKHSQEYFYKLRLNGLNKEEVRLAEYLSAFRHMPDKSLVSLLMHKANINVDEVLINLKIKNILHVSGNFSKISFTSEGLRNYIYSKIRSKKEIHLKNASVLESYPPLNKTEIAYQYEAASEFVKSLEYYLQLFRESESVDAYAYQKKLLEHILEFPLPQEQRYQLQFELCKILHKSGDPVSALEHCEELLIYNTDPEILNEILIFKGVCLISTGKFEDGIKHIEQLVEILEDEQRKQSLEAEIASAYLDLNEFGNCEKLCMDIIQNLAASEETKGKCYNLLGLTSIHRDNDIDKAFDYFQEAESVYKNAGLKFRTAQMQMNLGNIMNMKDAGEEAEKLWESSFELNSLIGNLQQEAVLLLNFGVLYFNRLDYEKSAANYKQALSIFSSTGDLKGEGLVNYNLGEIYFITCDYKNAYNCLNTARSIFQRVQDTNEELETMFLLGKFYLAIGSSFDLTNLISDFELQAKRVPGEKHNYNLRFLKILMNNESLNYFHEIKDIINYYNKQGDRENYFRSSISAAEFLYDHQLYKEAFEEINKPELIEAAKTNDYCFAEWNLYFGLIIQQTGNHDVHPSEYFIKAYALIENLSISESTWKCLSILAEFYNKRGNSLKAEEYAYYAKALIEHISDNIGNERFSNSFLNRKEIKNSLSMCRKILLSNG